MNKQNFIDVLINFRDVFDDLRNALEEIQFDIPIESYPFGESFDEIGVDEWVDETIRQLKCEISTERQELFLKIIQELEYRCWEYDITNGFLEIELGNQHWVVSKYDYCKLKDLYDEIISW